MREIKFRGKSLKADSWVYGYYVHLEDFVRGRETHRIYSGPADSMPDGDGYDFSADYEDVDPNTVGQYTGLKDEDGVEIFEGDIVEVHEAPFNLSAIGVVIYYPETARFRIREQNKKYPRVFSFRKHDTYNDGYCTVGCDFDFHVLGNIHDNPELL